MKLCKQFSHMIDPAFIVGKAAGVFLARSLERS